MTPQPEKLGRLDRITSALRQIWRSAPTGKARRAWYGPGRPRLNDQRRALNWGRLLHLSQKERTRTIAREEEIELRELRNRQRDLEHGPLLAWLLRDGWR